MKVPARVMVLFILLTLAFLHGAVFTSKLPVPVDEVVRGYPYRALFGEIESRNALTNDTTKAILPWMEVAREQLLHFRAPLWNPYSFSGYPLLGNGQSAPFSPFFLATLFVPLPKQIVAMAALKIFVALLFTYLFARRAGTGEVAAIFSAAAFAFSVFQTVYLYYPVTSVTSLLPAALYAVLTAQERARRRDAVLLALIVAAMMAGGHPESVFHVALGAAGVLVIDLCLSPDKRSWLRRLRVPLLGAIGGLALSAPAWVPVLEQIRLSTRLGELHPQSYPLTMLWAMVSPNGFGNPVRHNWGWILNYSIVAVSYVGLIVLALFITAMLSRNTSARDRLWGIYAILLWLIALGKLFSAVPPFSITANDKLRVVALFFAVIVAARALERVRYWHIVPAVLCAGAAVYVYAMRPQILRPWDLIAPATVMALCLVPMRWRPHAAAILLTMELFVLNAGFNALVDRRYYKPQLPIVEALKRIAPREPYRIAGLDWMFLPNASAQYGLEDIRGTDPMSYRAYTDLLKPVVLDDPSIDFARLVNVQDPLLDALNVRYLMTEPGIEAGGRWRAVYRGLDGNLFENPAAASRFFVRKGDADVAVRACGPGCFRVRVHARTPAEIGSSQLDTPGWRVRNAERIYNQFIGFRVLSGERIVEVVYRPMSFWLSVPVALVAAVLLFWNRSRPSPVTAGPDAVPDL